MKKILFIITGLIYLLIISISCKKLLNEPVDNRTVLSNIDDIEDALIGIQPPSVHHFTDLMTDDYSFKEIAGSLNREALNYLKPIFTFEITKQSFKKSEFLLYGMNPHDAYLKYYFRINNASLILSRLENLDIDDKKRVNNVKGQALAIRAYCHYMLTALFAKQYNNSTAATDLGVPYIGEYNPSAIVHRPRSTVKEIYNNVEQDLIAALELIDSNNAKFSSKFYWSKSAISGLLSRLYLDKKDWDSVFKYADNVLNENRSPLSSLNVWAEAKGDVLEYGKMYFKAENPSYLMMGNNTFQLFAFVASGYYPYPVRKLLNTKGVDNVLFLYGSVIFDNILPTKLYYFADFKRRNMNLPLMTVDEVMFNRAEASLQSKGSFDLITSNDVKKLISSSEVNASAKTEFNSRLSAVASVQQGLDLLLELKRLRFFSEGMRWFDIKRHSLSVDHEFYGTRYIIDGSNPDSYVIQLPLEEIISNNLIK